MIFKSSIPGAHSCTERERLGATLSWTHVSFLRSAAQMAFQNGYTSFHFHGPKRHHQDKWTPAAVCGANELTPVLTAGPRSRNRFCAYADVQ